MEGEGRGGEGGSHVKKAVLATKCRESKQFDVKITQYRLTKYSF